MGNTRDRQLTHQLSVRISEPEHRRVKRVRDAMDTHQTGCISEAMILRMCILRGLDAIERDAWYKAVTPPCPIS